MKKTLGYVLFVFSFLSMACNFSLRSAQVDINQNINATQVQSQVAVTAILPTATPRLPSSTIEPTQNTLDTPTTEPASPAVPPSSPSPEPFSFTESFDRENQSWTDPIIVTSQAVGHDPFIKIKIAAGVLQIAISDKETYVYKFYKDQVTGNQFIQADFEPRGVINSGIALVCRADTEMTSWFEARLHPSESKYSLYRYDQKLKTADKNPYILLKSGIIAVKDFPPAKKNIFSISCFDDHLVLDINSGKKVITQDVDQSLDGSLSGLGVMSFDTLPAAYDFETVELSQTQ